ncbi:uncharacterized protein stmnd1 [Hippocampus comes]|uniref:uncharacterized protein stmnd1 n=1 Tax=Hippocampus comes TaxID=109280 RepID=UPI00094EBD2C|nr:PREDICTED: uncharacterized protein LOC109517727 [Hippocampus comes]
MGCGSSSTTAVVQPLPPADENDPGSKCDRGDSAVSKLTEDSGVVVAATMENGEPIPDGALPGEASLKPPGLLGKQLLMQERATSRDILEELQNEGIIPMSPSRETATGKAYTIFLDDSEGIRRRPPARLESLRVKRLPSKEKMEEKMRLADERRKSREDELTARLRSKSARIQRAAVFVPETGERKRCAHSPPDIDQRTPDEGERVADEHRDDEESWLVEAELVSA